MTEQCLTPLRHPAPWNQRITDPPLSLRLNVKNILLPCYVLDPQTWVLNLYVGPSSVYKWQNTSRSGVIRRKRIICLFVYITRRALSFLASPTDGSRDSCKSEAVPFYLHLIFFIFLVAPRSSNHYPQSSVILMRGKFNFSNSPNKNYKTEFYWLGFNSHL